MYTPFQTGTPEEVGLSSVEIREMLQDFEKAELYMHSVLVIRHGKLVAEGYYAPFTRDTKHRMYSISKSFVSGAIGCLIDEGKLKLSDKVHTFFPEFPAEELHPYIKDATVRDLLMMASPHHTTYALLGEERNATHWVESFFRTPPKRPAGTVFLYDTSSSFILDVIVERLTGKPFLDYLKDKMLRELGFSEDAWCVKSPDGYSWGGSGVICTPLDLARFAYVFLRDGNVCGKQLLSAQYVKEATANQIPTNNFGYASEHRADGYGYQIWQAPENSFFFNGMGQQFALCTPDKDLLFVCTADNQGIAGATGDILDAVVRHLIRPAADGPLPENPEALAALQAKLSGLSLYRPAGMAHSPLEKEIHNVTYVLDENPLGFKTVRFTFDGDTGVLHYENARGKKEITFGLTAYKEGIFPEPQYSGDTIGTPKGTGYRCLASAMWPTEKHLALRVNIVDDYFGNWGVTFGFKGDQIGLSSVKTAEAFLMDYVGTAGGKAIK